MDKLSSKNGETIFAVLFHFVVEASLPQTALISFAHLKQHMECVIFLVLWSLVAMLMIKLSAWTTKISYESNLIFLRKLCLLSFWTCYVLNVKWNLYQF